MMVGMSTTHSYDNLQLVAGLHAWEHGYATGYGLATSPREDDAALDRLPTVQLLAEAIARPFDMDEATLAEWRAGVDDAMRDVAEDRRLASMIAKEG